MQLELYAALTAQNIGMSKHLLQVSAMSMSTLKSRLVCLGAFFAIYSAASDAASSRDASLQARFASCDTTTFSSAVDEMLRDSKLIQDPGMLLPLATGQRAAGRKEEAAFLYLAALVRLSRQILFEKGDTPQLLITMRMTIGPLFMPILETDLELAQRVVKRTIDWDRNTPDLFRDREEAKSGNISKKIAEIDEWLIRLPDQIPSNPARIAKAQEENERVERQMKIMHMHRCGPGTLDSVDAEIAAERIKSQAELLVKAHPFVLSRAGGTVKSVSIGVFRQDANRLPSRLTVSVAPLTGRGFEAEVDAIASITMDRRLDSVKFTLVCITEVGLGSRDASWRDVCHGDPKALKPVGKHDDNLSRFDIDADGKSKESPPQKPVCGFPGLTLPRDFAVLAAGAYSGRKIPFQIDQSGHEGTQIDVAVNYPEKPVVLILGAYKPTIWNVVWSKETKILAVLIGGYHRQVIVGLESSTPVLISSNDNNGPCGYFYIDSDNVAQMEPLSKRVFGRPVDMVYPAIAGQADVGKSMLAGAVPVKFADITPESFYDRNAPIAGPAGLEAAVRNGLLRKATVADAQAWVDAVLQDSDQREPTSVAGQRVPSLPKVLLLNGYVVLKSFTYPSGLYGSNWATIVIPKGVPKPVGNPGHSAVYDFSTLSCQGVLCSVR